MHELSIAQSIFESVLNEKEKRNLPAIEKIGLRIGAMSGILADSLEFSFDAIKIDTDLAQTILEIEHISLKGRCKNCDSHFAVEDYAFSCPRCESGQIEVEQGMEMEIAFIEVADE